ncbi:hypothetical protein [Butyrivibrio sp. MC2013]|uniref:hypothetical protein n=1 Tax=Butyrivibrio sp. MC2013 TaxID=1280686 RepID=UPI00041FD518|nr:hypothetical protein [Butyrivibrio sp. MC2013]
MDYKVVRLAAAVFAALLILIGVIVYAENADRIRSSGDGSSSDAEETAGMSTELPSEGISLGEQIGSDLNGFIADKDFFDEPEDVSEVYAEDVTGVSLYPKGGEGTIEIAVKNDRGGLETGTIFAVLLKEAGDREGDGTVYKDDDRDGRILIEDLPEGEYVVTLQPREGYHVPLSGRTVTVSKASAASAGDTAQTVDPLNADQAGTLGTDNAGTDASEYTPVDFALPGIDYPVDGNIIGNPGQIQGTDILPSNAAEALSSEAGVRLGNDNGVDASAEAMTPGPLN